MANRARQLQPAHKSAEDLEWEVADIAAMNVEQLRVRWRQTHGQPPPKGLSKDLIARALAYRIQEAVLGGLSPGALRTLRLVMTSGVEPLQKIKVGSVLVREFGGMLHEVVVVPGGFLWQGGTYDSLSMIAKEITGTNWNGPRFFGLRDRRETLAELNAAPAEIGKVDGASQPRSRAGRRSSIATHGEAGQGTGWRSLREGAHPEMPALRDLHAQIDRT